MQKAPDDVMEVFLQPGEFWFGGSRTRIRTILGSCVSITAWHPERRIGGMCHYLIPTRRKSRGAELDGKHGDEAVQLLRREMLRHHTNPLDYEVKIFGGGDMFATSHAAKPATIGEQNVISGLRLLEGLGHKVVARHLRGNGHRQIVFDLWTGDVWVRQHALLPATKPINAAARAAMLAAA
jgi:chemotaxis protein CheD